jgi:hypothetical protein
VGREKEVMTNHGERRYRRPKASKKDVGREKDEMTSAASAGLLFTIYGQRPYMYSGSSRFSGPLLRIKKKRPSGRG